MKNIRTFFIMYRQLLGILSKKQKIKGIFLIILFILVSALEMLGIGVVIPFIIAMLEPESLLKNQYIAKIAAFLGLNNYNNILFIVAIGIIGVYVVKNVIILIANYYQADYRNKLEKELSIKLLSSYMKQPYTFFLDTNSADILRGVISDTAGYWRTRESSLKTADTGRKRSIYKQKEEQENGKYGEKI